MKNSFKNMIERLLFPWDACCNECGSEDVFKYVLCKKCFETLKAVDGNRCRICLDRINTVGLCRACLEKQPDYESLFAPFVFEGVLRTLIHGFKFKNKRYLYHSFSEMILDAVPDEIIANTDIIIPVPSAPERIRERGFNQALLLAKGISEATDIPIDTNVLKKKNGQKQMASLKKKERRENIKGFYYFCGSLENKNVLLVDDICTTGETLRECAHQLKCAGAGRIFCACIARTDIPE